MITFSISHCTPERCNHISYFSLLKFMGRVWENTAGRVLKKIKVSFLLLKEEGLPYYILYVYMVIRLTQEPDEGNLII